jgi:hypothetical protein
MLTTEYESYHLAATTRSSKVLLLKWMLTNAEINSKTFPKFRRIVPGSHLGICGFSPEQLQVKFMVD